MVLKVVEVIKMTREELFELKKEMILIKDFSEAEGFEEAAMEENISPESHIEEMEKQYSDGFVKLDETDQKWVNEKFVYWLDIYMLRQAKSGGCSSCSGGGCSN